MYLFRHSLKCDDYLSHICFVFFPSQSMFSEKLRLQNICRHALLQDLQSSGKKKSL